MQNLLNKNEWNYVKRNIINPVACYAVVFSTLFVSSMSFEAYNAINSGESREEFVQRGNNFIGQKIAETTFDLVSIVGGNENEG